MFANFSYNVSPNADDPNGGGGGGGGGGDSSNMPIGVVVPFAGSTAPADWLLCDGTEYRNDTIYEDLYNIIFFTYGVNGGDSSIAGIGAYSYTGNTLTFNMTTANLFCKVGTIVRPAGFVLATGQDINGTYVLITSAPAIGATGSATGTFVQPIAGTGSGNASVTANVNRASFAVPDLRLATPVGAQAGTINLASSGGSATTTLTPQNLPSHAHGIPGASGEGYTSFSSSGVGYGGSGSIASTLGSQTKTDAIVYTSAGATATASGASGTAISTRNPYVGMNYIIHAKN